MTVLVKEQSGFDKAAYAIVGALMTLETEHSKAASKAALEAIRTAYMSDPIADRVFELLGQGKRNWEN